MNKVKTVDEYIANIPNEIQDKLTKIREAIKEVAPKALEKISYGMPYYGYYGRLAYFGLSRNHIGLYIPPPVIEKHKEELKSYSTSISTVRIPLNKPLPLALIKKLIRARMEINEDIARKK